MGVVIMIMNCFCGMVDQRKAFSLIFSKDHWQRFSPSWISDTPQAEFEAAQNVISGFIEWSFAAMITTKPRRHHDRTMIEKSSIGKRMFNFKCTVMRESDYKEWLCWFLDYLRFLRVLKTTFGYYLSNFCVLISLQANVLFLYEIMEVWKRKSAGKTFS